jgi:hypothetical protein
MIECHDKRGNIYVRKLASEIQVGDKLMIWLTNATVLAEVTGWIDSEPRLLGFDRPTVRTFTVKNVPFWVESRDTRYGVDDDAAVFVRKWTSADEGKEFGGDW